MDKVTKKTTISSSSKNINNQSSDQAAPSQTAGYLVYFILGLLEFLLAFRLVFKLMGASPTSRFVSSIYALTTILIAPFAGIFRGATTTGIETAAVLEPSTIIAMIVYAVLAWGITQLVVILSRREQ